jgi:hypothetical protein
VNRKNLIALLLGLVVWIGIPFPWVDWGTENSLGWKLYVICILGFTTLMSLFFLVNSDKYQLPWEGKDRPIQTFFCPLLVIVPFIVSETSPLAGLFITPAALLGAYRYFRREAPIYDQAIMQQIERREKQF